MRHTTELVARVICLAGFFDSAAAMVTTSAPMKLNIVVSIAPMIALKPFGAKPPCSDINCPMPLTSRSGSRPMSAAPHRAMKAMMAMIFNSPNQNSNSP
ncbi:hypothetical protein D3C76_753360 [compost metagenome]